MVVESNHPYEWHRWDCIPLTHVAKGMHMRYRRALGLLVAKGIRVYRFPYGYLNRYLVPEVEARLMMRIHGSETARKLRMRRCAVKTKGRPLWWRCPYCGMTGKQWRSGFTRQGLRNVLCGHCRRTYSMGRREPIGTACPHCGSNKDQVRMGYDRGRQRVRCKPCWKLYLPSTDPDAPRTDRCETALARPRRTDEVPW
jgi:transposase-like protein